MRNAFMNELVMLAEQHDHIALVVGDLGYSVVEPFADRFPDRFINAGVAEQNMTGLAAGMASEGYHVFTYSIANFPVFRCAEQIRNDIDYQRLPVTVVSVGGGLAYGALGYSHHAVQDYALMRTLPNMLIASPGDPVEVRACMKYLVANGQPSYLRLGKAGEPSFHTSLPQITPGGWLKVNKAEQKANRRRAIVTTGAVLAYAMQWVKDPELVDVDVFSVPLWSMKDKFLQYDFASNYDSILTIEDHLVDAGFGSWMREALAFSNTNHPSLKNMGLNSDVCGLVGSQASLDRLGGLNLGEAKLGLL